MKIKSCIHKDECEICFRAKSTRLPFPKVNTESKGILKLVHTDVCGLHVETPSKNRYVLTVIDDYSRYTTLYLIKHKYEVKEKIRSFVKEMETQYGKTVKIIRSDNGGEYTSKSLSKYYETKRIRPQYTAPFTPQQNSGTKKQVTN